MKYIVMSDIHGSKYYMNIMRKKIDTISPDKIILLGDLYYHGPRNPLPKDYSPREVAEILNEYSKKILCCRGNCDAEVDEMISSFAFEDNHVLEIAGKKLYFTHGHHENIDNPIDSADIMVYGHYHTGFIIKRDDKTFINSGSISLPKEGTPNSYLYIDESVIELRDLDDNVIDKYDFFYELNKK